MADASQAFTVIQQPNIPIANAGVFSIDLGPCYVRRILLTWPPGCGGLVGVQIQAGGSGAFPFGKDVFFVFDDYTYPFDVDNQTNSGKWGVRIYNIDQIQHGIQVVFEYDYLRGNVLGNQSIPVAL